MTRTQAEQVALLLRRIEESGLSRQEFAVQVMKRHPRTIHKWLSQESPIPKGVLALLETPAGVVRVSNDDLYGTCRVCGDGFSGLGSDFELKVNHYLQEHGYRILHVGQETTRDEDENPWQITVAILGI